MTLPLFRTAPLISPAPPRLPTAPAQYEPRFHDLYSDVLRLYFTQLQNFNQLFTTNTGGALLKFPNGAFYQDGYSTLTANIGNGTTTPIPVVSTASFLPSGGLIIENEIIRYTGKTATTFTGITRGAYGTSSSAHTSGTAVAEAQVIVPPATTIPISFTSTTTSNGVAIDGTYNSRIVFDVAGYYNIQFSAQLLNYTTSDDNVVFWFRQNGTDIPFSAGVITVPSKHGSSPGAFISSWNLVQGVAAGDYVELVMTSETGNTVVATYPPGVAPSAVHPASPSIILTATFVSALYT